jgi:hypothetical protein
MTPRNEALARYLESRAAEIEQDAVDYAANYKCSLEVARCDVTDEYRCGWFEAQEALQSGDWDFGRE